MLCAGQTGRWISRARCAEGNEIRWGKGGMKMDHRDALKIAIERLEKRCAECEENDELLMRLISCLCKALETREKLGEDSGRMEIVLRGAPGGEEAR